MDYSDILKLVSFADSSSFYLVNRNRFEANYNGLTAAFQSHYNPFILAYSYKTNYIPYLCGIINQKGGWAEVVSRMEYDLALKIGCDPKKIIFNGPVKTADDIQLALDSGSMLNVDSQAEIKIVDDYAKTHPDKQVRIGLRMNIGLSDEAGHSHIQNALKIGRFGYDPDSLKSEEWRLRNQKNLKIVGLHGHTSTTNRSPWCFEVITKTLCHIAEKYFPNTIEYINIGGGFYGHMHPDMPFDDTPGFDDYALVVSDVLNGNLWAKTKNPTLIIEPGVAMVADAVSFITEVVSVKTVQNKKFITVDGSAFNTKPTFHTINMPHQFIMKQPTKKVQTFDVVGSTCMEKDIILKDITSPLPQPGDYLKIESVGAYTLVMTPPFINPAPAVLADESGRYKCIRRKQTLDEVFSNYLFE